jgi:hypothetical protein
MVPPAFTILIGGKEVNTEQRTSNKISRSANLFIFGTNNPFSRPAFIACGRIFDSARTFSVYESYRIQTLSLLLAKINLGDKQIL